MRPELPTRPGADLPPALADGRYVMHGFLGEGARKAVYLAHDTRLDRDVAVAIIAVAALDELGQERIRREAQAMARLGSHPNIVTVHDFGQEGEVAYIVSEYMARGAVADLLDEAGGRGVAIGEAMRLAREVAAALDHAHRAGLVHRDVKPANVFLNEDGHARLGDFGVALALDRPRVTAEGGMVGTLDYMPPEQALGRPVDERSDLYSLGAMLYELLTGRPPFRGDDMVAVVSQHINNAPVAPSWPNPDVPPALEALVLEMLAKDPDARPASAEEVRRALERLETAPGNGSAVAEEANPLGRLAQGAFVGRRSELERLRALVDDAVAGRGAAAMLVGEAGIGKTRTVEEAAAYAGLRGARVLWGRCYEGDGAPAYWPWVQVVRSYLAMRPEEAWRAEMGAGAGLIARVVRQVGASEPADAEESSEQARFRFFEAIGRFLAAAAADRPLVLVLDDLHWADVSSLLLLGFLQREVGRERILLLGTYRDAEVERDHPLASLGGERLALGGLAEDDVARFIEARAGVTAPARLVRTAHERTEGNPFFLSEIVRLLVTEGEDAASVPQGVRDVLGQRLDRLSDDTRTVLSAAAVIGRDFRLDVLQRVADLPAERVLDALDEATDAQVVAIGKPGRFRFAHALVRETIHDELGSMKRLRLHLRAAEALEAIHERARGAHAAELAHHWFEALQLAGPDKAVDYSIAAARRAHDGLAYEDAVGHYDRACRALELAGLDDDPRRLELLLARGEEETHAGAYEPSQVSFRDAAELARALRSPDLQARAALGFAQWSVLGANDPAVELLEEALAALPASDSARRAEVLAELAIHLEPGVHRERKDTLSAEAVEMARRVGDRTQLALLLALRHAAIWGPDNLAERLELADEDLALSLETGDRSRVRWAHFLRFVNRLEAGEVAEADRALDEFARTADELGQPYHQWYAAFMRRTRALMEGRMDDAERLAVLASELWETDDPENAWAATIQDVPLRWMEGRLAEVRPAAVEAVGSYGSVGAYRCLLAFIDTETGHADAARRELDRLAAGGFAELPRDGQWLAGMALLAQAAASAGDATHAAALAELLAPYGEHWVLFDAGWACLGPGARALGLLAGLRGDHAEAVERLDEAVALAAAVGARPWLAQAQHDLARELSIAGEEERAKIVEAEGLALAVDLGLHGLADKLRTFRRTERAPTLSSVEVLAMTIEEETPARLEGAEAEPVALLFSDIEGSTELNEQLGDDRWLAVLEDHNEIVRQALAEHRGSEVKSQGDGFMLAFSDPGDAVACAVAMQRSFARRNVERPECRLLVRVGLHAGPAIRRGRDFFGRNVVVAARIAAQARGGEILASEELSVLAGADEGEPQELALKGLRGTQRVRRVPWDQL